jgi:MFS family permease
MAVGILVGPSFGGVLYELGGYSLPFFVATGFALLDGLARFILLRDAPHSAAPRSSFAPLLRERQIIVIAGVVILGAGIPALLEPTLPLHLQNQLGASPVLIGVLFGAPTLAIGISAPLSGALSDRIGRSLTIAIGLVATACAVPLLALPHSLLGEAGALFLLGVTAGFATAPTLPMLADVTDRLGGGMYGSAFAVYNTAYSVGLMIGPVAGGLLAGAFGFAMALLVAGGVVLLYAPLMVLTARHHPAGEDSHSVAGAAH